MSTPSLPQIDLAVLQEAIKTTIRAAFPSTGAGAVKVVDYYDRRTLKIDTPAVLFELTGITPSAPPDDVGTQQFSATLEFSAYVMVSYKETKAKVAVQTLAAKVLALIRGNRWGQKIQQAEVDGAFPDRMEVQNPPPNSAPQRQADAYEVWRIDWRHEALLGVSVWDPDGSITPSQVWLGIDPETGPENIEKYTRVFPQPPIPHPPV